MTAELLKINATLGALHRAASKALVRTPPGSERGYTDESWDVYEKASSALQDSVRAVLGARVPVGTEVEAVDGPLVVAETPHAREYVLTDDGGPMSSLWHEGPSSDDWVRCERWAFQEGNHTEATWRRVSHGYLHPDTRKIVQTG